MVVANLPTNTTAARFRALPWHDSHPNKLDIEQRLSPDHLARTIDAAVEHLEHEELIEALRARMTQPKSQALYRLRKQTVQLVNADMKQHRKLRRFSGRGIALARCAVGLTVLAHNLLTLVREEAKAEAKRAQASAATSEPSSL